MVEVYRSGNSWFVVSRDVVFNKVSTYYGVEGAAIGSVSSNPHVHVEPHSEASLPMTPRAPMLSKVPLLCLWGAM